MSESTWAIVKAPKETIGFFVHNDEWAYDIVCLECVSDDEVQTSRQVTREEHGGGLSCERCGRELGA